MKVAKLVGAVERVV